MNSDQQPVKPALLVVEDDPDQRKCLRRLLVPTWDVFFAGALEESETCLARHPEIGILLCDHELPDGKGLDFCMRLHQRDAPVIRILITGQMNEKLLIEAVNSNCLFHFVSKPFESAELLALLERASVAHREAGEAYRKAVEAEQDARRKPVLHFLSHWAQILFGLGSFLIATLLIVLVVTLALGSLVFILLYVLKSFLGIDIFADRHLQDFLPF